MASENQSEEKFGPPDPPIAPFQWGRFLSAVKDQIPSMDSDISVSDGDEDGDLFIFQRDQSNLIPDLSEELEDVSPDISDLQNRFTFMRRPQELWNEEVDSSSFHEEKSVPQSGSRAHVPLHRGRCDLAIKEPSNQQGAAPSEFTLHEHEPEEGISGIFGEEDPVPQKCEKTRALTPDDLPSAEQSPFLNEKEKQSEINREKERRKLIETKVLSKVTLGGPQPKNNNNNLERLAEGESERGAVSAEHPQELGLFALEGIEKWDLNKVLQDLEVQSNGSRSQTAGVAFSSTDQESYRAVSQTKLMGKLEELCLKQSRAFFMHRRRRLAKLPHFNECQGDGRDVPILAPLTNGQSSTPMELQYTPEPPTVYIDLRESQECELLANGAQSSSDSSAESEEDTNVMGRGKGRERMEEFSQPSRKDFTGKCFLLQQLRNFRQGTSQTFAKGSEAIIQDKRRRQNIKTMEETGLPKVRKRRCLKLRGLTSLGPVNSGSTARSFPFTGDINSTTSSSRELEKAIGQGPQVSLEEKGTDFPRTQGNQKEKPVQEKQRRQRLPDQLERSKPQLSITGKQPVAEHIPVFFHTEASYLTPVRSLPGPKGLESKMLQLTVELSGYGCVSRGCQQSGSFPETSVSSANIYPAVVTWLLSLVPSLGDKGESKAPFHVLGLQQAWHKGVLALRACLIPVCESDKQSSSGLQKHKLEESLQRTSLFCQQTSIFLSQTSLSDVIWWKTELATGCLQDQPYPVLPQIPDICLSDITTVHSEPQTVEEAGAVPAGFYWQTVETDEKYFSGGSDIRESGDTDTEVAMALLFETLLRNPVAVHHTFQLILASGLDICGLRLLYPPCNVLLSSTVALPPSYTLEKELPVLAVSLRGSKARSVLQDILGPSDPQLARVTNSCSINATYCTSPAQPLVYLPHTDSQVYRELSVWFGGSVL
ncbi:dynein axonemal assembly factor 8 [Eublepharis macularius]|uniref:Dynein axonemal assembly factor 8 n=1 Tax=Eublepharis macularius TaxID=481883 RepID=A0AA97K4C4_EUBMA|nr:dynein axonemal assembly factor 8 [Eublepharis macularius]